MRQLSANEVWVRVVYLFVIDLFVLALGASLGASLTKVVWTVLGLTVLQILIYTIDDRKKGNK